MELARHTECATPRMNTPSSNRRLQIATRIHYALMRELGHGIDVGRLLKYPLYARDVLLVCDACTGNDLHRLAVAFRGITPAAGARPSAFGASGFGASGFGPSPLSASQFASSGPPSQGSTPPQDWAESQTAA
jgi:hypothetical protein